MDENHLQDDLSPHQHELVEEVARSTIKQYRNRAVLGFVVLLAAVLYLFNEQDQASIDRVNDAKEARSQIVRSGNVVAADACNRDFRDRQAVRGVLAASKVRERRSYERGIISRARYEESVRFFDAQLEKLVLPDCRKSINILTDDPNKPLQFPSPLYPKK